MSFCVLLSDVQQESVVLEVWPALILVTVKTAIVFVQNVLS